MEEITGDKVAIDAVLRRLIEERDLKQTEIAKAINMAQSTLHDWTYGRAPRDLESVKALANYFNVSFEYLVFGTKQDQDELKKKIERLEFENAMIKLESENQMNLFESPEEGKKRIEEMQKAYYEKFGVKI
jgi:transcriptional regulator with XRE-family HTH domain